LPLFPHRQQILWSFVGKNQQKHQSLSNQRQLGKPVNDEPELFTSLITSNFLQGITKKAGEDHP